jgi:hypothetical protein
MTQKISQTITGLTPGTGYYLSFNHAFGQQQGFTGDTRQTLTVEFGSFSFTSSTVLPGTGFSGWGTTEEWLTADSTSEVLSFLAYGNLPVPPFALVSDVSLTDGAPEPATWTLMGLGFAGLGFAAYRRRAKAGAPAVA